MPTSTLTSDQDRILAFISLLEDDVAEQLLRRIDPDVSRRIRESLRTTRSQRPSARAQVQLLDEFDRYFRFARKFSKPVDREPVAPRRETVETQLPPLSDDPMHDLEHMNVVQLTTAMAGEAPRTCVLLMQQMSAGRTAEILAGMKAEQRDAIVGELMRNPKAPAILVQQVARTTVARASRLPVSRNEDPDPDQRVADVLRAADRRSRRGMLRTLQQQDADMASRIQRKLFRFEDLAGLDDQQIRAVLGKVETGTVSAALFGCDETIMDRVMSNLSRRARETLQEELGFLTRVPESQQQQARAAICDAIAEAEMGAE